jgi:hypothetical protein
MTSSRDISPEEMAGCRQGAQRRQQAEQAALAAREERAWTLAGQAADALCQRFSVSKVAVFSSLIHPGCFTPWADVDGTACGLRSAETFRAIGVVMDLDAEIAVNMVDVTACSPSLLRVIEQEGVPL